MKDRKLGYVALRILLKVSNPQRTKASRVNDNANGYAPSVENSPTHFIPLLRFFFKLTEIWAKPLANFHHFFWKALAQISVSLKKQRRFFVKALAAHDVFFFQHLTKADDQILLTPNRQIVQVSNLFAAQNIK